MPVCGHHDCRHCGHPGHRHKRSVGGYYKGPTRDRFTRQMTRVCKSFELTQAPDGSQWDDLTIDGHKAKVRICEGEVFIQTHHLDKFPFPKRSEGWKYSCYIRDAVVNAEAKKAQERLRQEQELERIKAYRHEAQKKREAQERLRQQSLENLASIRETVLTRHLRDVEFNGTTTGEVEMVVRRVVSVDEARRMLGSLEDTQVVRKYR